MSYSREIVILANSAKKGGCCVAGKDIRTGEWIRPVSTFGGGELLGKQITLDGYKPNPLHIAIVGFETHSPLPNQPENHLINDSKWQRAGKLDRSALDQFLDTPEHLWMYSRKQDSVDAKLFEYGLIDNHQSLYLIKVKSITYNVVHNYNGDQRLKGTFDYNGSKYTFNVTDPAYCQYKNGPLGHSFVEYDKYLCLSLGEKFEATGQCYKLIASVI